MNNNVLDLVYPITSEEELARLRTLAASFGDTTVSGALNGVVYVYMPDGNGRLQSFTKAGFTLYSMEDWVTQVQQAKMPEVAPQVQTEAPAPSSVSLGYVGVATRIVPLGISAGQPSSAPVNFEPPKPTREVFEAYIEALPQIAPTAPHGTLSLPYGVYRWMREADGFHAAWYPADKLNGEHLGPFTGRKHEGWQALIEAVTAHARTKTGYHQDADTAVEAESHASPAITAAFPVEAVAFDTVGGSTTASSPASDEADAAEYDDDDGSGAS